MPDFDIDSYLKGKNESAAAEFDIHSYLDKPTERRLPPDVPVGSHAARVWERANPSVDSSVLQGDQNDLLKARAKRTLETNRSKFIADNKQPGVDMDLSYELPAGVKARAGLDSNIENQAKLVGQQEGVLSAWVSKDGGNVVARIKGADGKEKDVLLYRKSNELSLGDAAAHSGDIIKGAAGVGAGIASGGMSLPATALLMGGVAAGTEASLLLGSRLAAGQEVDPGDIAKRAGAAGAVDAALPLAAGGAKWVGGKLMNVFGGSGPKEIATKAAASRLGLPLQPSMARDSQVLRDAERLSPTSRFDAGQEAALRDTYEKKIVGAKPSGVLSESEIAERSQPIFAEGEKAASAGLKRAQTDAEKAASDQIQSMLDNGLTPSNRTHSEVGDIVRKKIAGAAPDSKASELRATDKTLFGEVRRIADEDAVVVRPSNIEAFANELTAPNKEALLALNPGLRKIKQISDLLTKGEPSAVPLSFQDARELRSAVYEMAHSPGAPGQAGMSKEKLMKFYGAIDDDMKAAHTAASGRFKIANETAEEFHKKHIQPLQQSDVAKLFLQTDAAGRLGDEEIVTRLFSGKGNLDSLLAYKNVLGANSPEYKLLVRQGLSDLMGKPGVTGTVDAGDFLKRLSALTPGMETEVLGTMASGIKGNARLMARAQGAKISAEDLADALGASPGRAPRLLEQAIAREETYAKEYLGSFQQSLRDGTLGPRTMGRPEDFVQRVVLDKGASQSEVRNALTQIAKKDPAAADAIRQRTWRHILEDAKTTPKAGDIDTVILDAGKLLKWAKGKEGDNARVLIGDAGAEALNDLATYFAANEKRATKLFGGVDRTPGGIVHDAAGAAVGSNISVARLGLDAALSIPRALTGAANDLSPNLRRFLATGQTPSLADLGVKNKALQSTVKAGVLAAPGIVEDLNENRNRQRVLAEKQ